MYADAFATHTAQAPAQPLYAQADTAERERSRTLIGSLNAADRTYDAMGEHLKRALGYERRPLFREPSRVRAELEIAARKLAVLTRQVEKALANLPVEG